MSFSDALKAGALLGVAIATIVAGIKIFVLAIAGDIHSIAIWLAISAVTTALAAVIVRPRDWLRLGILWPMVVAGGLTGHALYIYTRSNIIPLDFFLQIELAIGFLAGMIPGLALSKYWK